MKKKEYVAIWLSDLYARLLLGLSPAQQPSRWVAVGEFLEDESHIGFWIALDRLEERRTDTERVIYAVTPNICVIRWDAMITIQRVKQGSQPEIGIKPN
jgi:hypothetical protein